MRVSIGFFVQIHFVNTYLTQITHFLKLLTLNRKLMIALLMEIVISKASFPPQEHVGQVCLEGVEVRETLAENGVLW
jgi:hypothetical protein